jgi:hypothetical protein
MVPRVAACGVTVAWRTTSLRRCVAEGGTKVEALDSMVVVRLPSGAGCLSAGGGGHCSVGLHGMDVSRKVESPG